MMTKYLGCTGAAIHSAMDMPGGASSQEAARGDDPVDEGRLDSCSRQPQVQGVPCYVKKLGAYATLQACMHV